MRSRVSSPNLVCSTYFSLCSCKKNHAHKRQYCYDCHNFKQNGNYLISSHLRETNSSIVHVNYWSLPIIFSQNNGQCFFDITILFLICTSESWYSIFFIYFSMHFFCEYRKKLSS